MLCSSGFVYYFVLSLFMDIKDKKYNWICCIYTISSICSRLFNFDVYIYYFQYWL